MPLSAAFCFFSPFLSEKKLLYQSFSLLFSSLLFSFHLSPVKSLSTPIFVILLDTIKYNKKSGDLHGKSPLSINTLYIIIYLYEESLSSII